MKKLYIPIIAVICCVIPLMVVGLILITQPKSQKTPNSQLQLGEAVPILPTRNHVEKFDIAYNSNPPTSGDHWPEPAEWGFYEWGIPDQQLIHNLEHGGIWISYKDIDTATKEKLAGLAKKYPQAVIVTERLENDSKIAIASWGRLMKLNDFDGKKIETFIKANINKSPEPQVSLALPAIRVGTDFPIFSVKEVDGKTITNDTLKGKSAIVWFTTSWCVPCQIGALEVARLDNELGEKTFQVLVIFVDPNETFSALREWRKNFANSDWIVALDNELTQLAKKVNLRLLDSKFLLNKEGIIQNIDFKIADEEYLNTIKRLVQ